MTTNELLTSNLEILYAKQYKLKLIIDRQKKLLMKKSNNVYVSDDEVAKSLQLTNEKMNKIIQTGETAKGILVNNNMRLVLHIGKFYRYRGVSFPDLVQEGTVGLMKAIDKFDPDRGFRFSTYASWWIKQSISRAIAEKSRIVRLPVHIHDLLGSVTRAEKKFTSEHMRKPNLRELAEELALPLDKVELLIKCCGDVGSIDEDAYQKRGKAASNNEIQVRDRLPSNTAEPKFINQKKSVTSELQRAMKQLTPREAEIIEMRFGLLDGNERTLEEIGQVFNVTRERIRQIEAKALCKLRQPIELPEYKEVFNQVTYSDNFIEEYA